MEIDIYLREFPFHESFGFFLFFPFGENKLQKTMEEKLSFKPTQMMNFYRWKFSENVYAKSITILLPPTQTVSACIKERLTCIIKLNIVSQPT